MLLPGCRPARRGFWLSWEVPPLQNLSPGPGGFSSRVGCGGDPRARKSWGSASPDAASLPSLWHQNGSRWDRRELLSQPSCFPGLGSPQLPRVCIKGQRWASRGESKVGGGLVPQNGLLCPRQGEAKRRSHREHCWLLPHPDPPRAGDSPPHSLRDVWNLAAPPPAFACASRGRKYTEGGAGWARDGLKGIMAQSFHFKLAARNTFTLGYK